MFFTDAELDLHIRRRPSVQIVCLGAYLQQPMFLAADVLAVPLSASGCGHLATLFGGYISMDLDIHISISEVEEFKGLWKDTYPGTALVWHPTHDASTEELERSADRSFARAKRNLSLVTGDRFEVVGTIVLHDNGQVYRLTPPRSKRRQRLWFSREEALDFQRKVVCLAERSESDSRISLALQMYFDSANERSEEFRIVKFYNVLECLASNHKKDGVGSRDAVRTLLNVAAGKLWTVDFKGANIHFDVIAVAGRFRDSLMHGSRIDRDTFSVNDRGVIDVLAFEPFKVADELHRLVDDAFWTIATE
jgi:hypothetical protein